MGLCVASITELRLAREGLPVLMLTGHETPKNLSRSRTRKIDGFLVKRATARGAAFSMR